MARTREELDRMNEISPELTEALKKRPFPDLSIGGDKRTARAAHLRTLRHLMPVPGPIPDQVTEQEHHVAARDGYKVKVISYKPAKHTTPGPLVVLYHEGGWTKGDLTDEEFNARQFTRDLGAICLNVEYRLGPEHVFPTGINDCWDVLQWAARSATSTLNADPTQGLIVGGSSAGGNISAILAHLSRNTNLQPPITGQWLAVPFLFSSNHVPPKYKPEYISMLGSHNDPVLPPSDDTDPNGKINTTLKPDMDSPLFSVLSPELYPPDLSDKKPALAPAYFQIAGLDPLRDHGLVYERIMREEYGVPTRLDIYPGFGHMFWTNWPEMGTSKKFARDTLDGLRWLLGKPAGG